MGRALRFHPSVRACCHTESTPHSSCFLRGLPVGGQKCPDSFQDDTNPRFRHLRQSGNTLHVARGPETQHAVLDLETKWSTIPHVFLCTCAPLSPVREFYMSRYTRKV